jgi:peptide-methionine (S)-S-oxide reductase
MSKALEVAVLGGGCFWCTEAIFKMLRGITAVVPGYAGGTVKNPTYEEVCSGSTGHAEAVRVEFDPDEIRFEDLLTVFFGSHDPTIRNRQGNDVGTQYRSVIFFTDEIQKIKAEKFIADLNASNKDGKPIVTELEPLSEFYEAEDYHRDYFTRNPGNPYCEVIINPKLEKVQQRFAELLKSHSAKQ